MPAFRVVALVALPITAFAIAVLAQNSGGSGIIIRINPETHLDSPVVQLSFAVVNPGQIALSKPVTVTAWVRSLDNQLIVLTALPVALIGPRALCRRGPFTGLDPWNPLPGEPLPRSARAAISAAGRRSN